MTLAFDNKPSERQRGSSIAPLSGSLIAASTLFFEVASIVLVATVSGIGYHIWQYGEAGSLTAYTTLGVLVALAYGGSVVVSDGLKLKQSCIDRRGFQKVASAWNCAFILLLVSVFMTKSGDDISRGWIAFFYAIGFAAVLATDFASSKIFQRLREAGFVKPRRVMAIGSPLALANYRRDHVTANSGVVVVEEIFATGLTTPKDSCTVSAQNWLPATRDLKIDDVIILSESLPDETVRDSIDALMDLPVRIHLGVPNFLGTQPTISATKLGDTTTLAITEPRTDFFDVAPKRALDVCLSLLALILLAPLFALIATAIKFDTPGPVFFRQRRRGFNQKEFRIWKFRTMTTLDDGPVIEQAKSDDPRITRVGSYLRRSNLDELPQLLNVFMGQMSLVGPRPHAVAHDEDYQLRIERYARRLNVKPGITGWAQVNGLRGETRTEHQMRERVRHDLYYIDNWSVAFDLFIMLLTVFSPRAFKNAH
ncbi:MAG: exopolysaccharide biosynthesis polyprenyl glycosylphosphotransferase [Pseudomonadota bacterium]